MNKKSASGFLLWIACIGVIAACTVPFKGAQFGVKVFAFLIGLSAVGFLVMAAREVFKS
jgi:hypothetical protein